MLDQTTRQKMQRIERRYQAGKLRYLTVFGSSFGLLAGFAPLAYRHFGSGAGVDAFLMLQLIGTVLLGWGFALFQWNIMIDEREHLRREYPFDYPNGASH